MAKQLYGSLYHYHRGTVLWKPGRKPKTGGLQSCRPLLTGRIKGSCLSVGPTIGTPSKLEGILGFSYKEISWVKFSYFLKVTLLFNTGISSPFSS